MARIICDYFEKEPSRVRCEDPDNTLSRKITAVNNMYSWLYKAGLLTKASFIFKESPRDAAFALDAKDLLPYRKQMEASGVEDAHIAVHHIFDEEYTPCVYSGVIQLIWPMATYRDVDGCVGRSWECDLIKGLNTEAIYEVSKVRDEQGVKEAVKKLFSYYIWEEPELSGISADGSPIMLDTMKLKTYIEDEMILEFASAEECRAYFNTYDSQDFHSAEEMKAYQGEYGFGIGEKWYHISFDEALDVWHKPSLDRQIESAAERSSGIAEANHISPLDKEPGR